MITYLFLVVVVDGTSKAKRLAMKPQRGVTKTPSLLLDALPAKKREARDRTHPPPKGQATTLFEWWKGAVHGEVVSKLGISG
jgi:hypothetical protein